MQSIFVSESRKEMEDLVMEELMKVLQETSTNGKEVSIGLSGGSMPEVISPSLLKLTNVDWSLVHIFFCDERIVPFDSPDSTYAVYAEMLFSKLTVLPAANVHKIRPNLPIEEVARHYQSDMLSFFGAEKGYPTFDLLLLGLGPDGHTCSLFPNSNLLSVEDDAVALVTNSPKPPPNRVTLTIPVLNKANKVIFIVTGANKAEVVAKILSGGNPTPQYPASLIQPLAGPASWYLDRAAAELLELK